MRATLVLPMGLPSVCRRNVGEPFRSSVTRSDSTISEADVLAFCREPVARYKCPTSVDWMAHDPRNPSIRILKNPLRAPHSKGMVRRVSRMTRASIGRYGPAALRPARLRWFTSVMPAITPTSASTNCSVSGSPSSSTPNTSANTGVRNEKVAICVAG
jgi:hypothetical protein